MSNFFSNGIVVMLGRIWGYRMVSMIFRLGDIVYLWYNIGIKEE